MAKKSRSKPQAKAKSKPKKAPAQVSVKKQAAVIAPAPQPAARPRRATAAPKPKTMLSPFEFAAFILGVILLVVGIVWAFLSAPQPAPTDVKSQVIPMTMDDFKNDPSIQHAIQKQLGGTTDQAQTPQVQPNQPPQATGSDLQSTATGLQPQ